VIILHQGDLKRLPDGEYLNDSLNVNLDGNETCIVHIDSLNVHEPSFIQKLLRS